MICDIVRKKLEEHYRFLPKELQRKKKQLSQVNNQIRNLVRFIANELQSQSVADELKACELRKQTLEQEIQSILLAKQRIPSAPSAQVVEDKLRDVKKLFENDITRAAQLIRKLIGKIAVECRTDDRGKEYLDYSAVIDSLKVFSLFLSSGSNSLIWWR